MKYKKGIGPIAIVMAVFIAILLFLFLAGGGISTTWEITKFLKSIPTFVWVILGIIILFKLLGKRR